MQIVLYFKKRKTNGSGYSVSFNEAEERLRVEIIGIPEKVERVKQIVRETVLDWPGWEEA